MCRSTTIPKLSSSNFMWNGQPSATLMEDIIYPLYMGLGSIQDHQSLLMTTMMLILWILSTFHTLLTKLLGINLYVFYV
jgi:hypothetical protein